MLLLLGKQDQLGFGKFSVSQMICLSHTWLRSSREGLCKTHLGNLAQQMTTDQRYTLPYMSSLPLKLHKPWNDSDLAVEEFLLITEFPSSLMIWGTKLILYWFIEIKHMIFLATHAGLNIHEMNKLKCHIHTSEDNTRVMHQILSPILRKLILIFLAFSCRNTVPGCFHTNYSNNLILLIIGILYQPQKSRMQLLQAMEAKHKTIVELAKGSICWWFMYTSAGQAFMPIFF